MEKNFWQAKRGGLSRVGPCLNPSLDTRGGGEAKFVYDILIVCAMSIEEWACQQFVSLEKFGSVKVCIPDRDFMLGQNIFECWFEAIVASRFVLLLITDNFWVGEFGEWVAQIAVYRDITRGSRKVIPVICEGSVRTTHAKLPYLELLHPLDIVSESGRVLFWPKLDELLKEKRHPSTSVETRKKWLPPLPSRGVASFLGNAFGIFGSAFKGATDFLGNMFEAFGSTLKGERNLSTSQQDADNLEQWDADNLEQLQESQDADSLEQHNTDDTALNIKPINYSSERVSEQSDHPTSFKSCVIEAVSSTTSSDTNKEDTVQSDNNLGQFSDSTTFDDTSPAIKSSMQYHEIATELSAANPIASTGHLFQPQSESTASNCYPTTAIAVQCTSVPVSSKTIELVEKEGYIQIKENSNANDFEDVKIGGTTLILAKATINNSAKNIDMLPSEDNLDE